MRKTLTAVAAATIAAASLTACDIDGSLVTDGTLPPTTTATTVDDTTTDAAFNAVMRQYNLPAGPKSIDAAHATCDALNSGVTAEQVAIIALDSFDTTDDAGHFLGAAVAAYCPEFSDDIASIGSNPA